MLQYPQTAIVPKALSSFSNLSKSTRITERNVTYALMVNPMTPEHTANSKKSAQEMSAKLAIPQIVRLKLYTQSRFTNGLSDMKPIIIRPNVFIIP